MDERTDTVAVQQVGRVLVFYGPLTPTVAEPCHFNGNPRDVPTALSEMRVDPFTRLLITEPANANVQVPLTDPPPKAGALKSICPATSKRWVVPPTPRVFHFVDIGELIAGFVESQPDDTPITRNVAVVEAFPLTVPLLLIRSNMPRVPLTTVL